MRWRFWAAILVKGRELWITLETLGSNYCLPLFSLGFNWCFASVFLYLSLLVFLAYVRNRTLPDSKMAPKKMLRFLHEAGLLPFS